MAVSIAVRRDAVARVRRIGQRPMSSELTTSETQGLASLGVRFPGRECIMPQGRCGVKSVKSAFCGYVNAQNRSGQSFTVLCPSRWFAPVEKLRPTFLAI